MAEERKQSDRLRLWLWRRLALVLSIVFFTARYLLRDRLEVREVQVGHEILRNTLSTNGRVEPEVNFQFYSPLATTVKAVYVQAREATAESGVKSAQAALDAATHNGTQEQQQLAAGDIARTRLERDQAQHDLDALIKLNSTGAASASEVSAARQRLQTAEASLHASETSANSRYSPAEVARAQAA